jgi:hypothetical protein
MEEFFNRASGLTGRFLQAAHIYRVSLYLSLSDLDAHGAWVAVVTPCVFIAK